MDDISASYFRSLSNQVFLYQNIEPVVELRIQVTVNKKILSFLLIKQ